MDPAGQFLIHLVQQFPQETAKEPAPGGFPWSSSDSNRLPPACKAGALPVELEPHRSGRRDRTSTSPRNRRLLYQLSYTGMRASTVALLSTTGGIRTPTLWFEARDAHSLTPRWRGMPLGGSIESRNRNLDIPMSRRLVGTAGFEPVLACSTVIEHVGSRSRCAVQLRHVPLLAALPPPSSRSRESNPNPPAYEAGARPRELLRQGRRPKSRTPLDMVWNHVWARPAAYASLRTPVGKGGLAPPAPAYETGVLLAELPPVGWLTGVKPASPDSQSGALIN